MADLGLDAEGDAGPNAALPLDDGGDSRAQPSWDPVSCVPVGATPVAIASGVSSPASGL
jgi:hypothetical protein